MPYSFTSDLNNDTVHDIHSTVTKLDLHDQKTLQTACQSIYDDTKMSKMSAFDLLASQFGTGMVRGHARLAIGGKAATTIQSNLKPMSTNAKSALSSLFSRHRDELIISKMTGRQFGSYLTEAWVERGLPVPSAGYNDLQPSSFSPTSNPYSSQPDILSSSLPTGVSARSYKPRQISTTLSDHQTAISNNLPAPASYSQKVGARLDDASTESFRYSSDCEASSDWSMDNLGSSQSSDDAYSRSEPSSVWKPDTTSSSRFLSNRTSAWLNDSSNNFTDVSAPASTGAWSAYTEKASRLLSSLSPFSRPGRTLGNTYRPSLRSDYV